MSDPEEGGSGTSQPAGDGEGVRSARKLVPGVVPRWVQLALLPILLLAAWVIIQAAGKVVMMFIVAAIIALILNPVVNLLRRAGARRGLAVFAVYLGFFIALAAVGYLLAHPIANQATRFGKSLPHIIDEANKGLAEFQTEANESGFHIHILKQGQTALQTLESKVAKSSSTVAEVSGEVLKEAVAVLFDLIIVFVLSVYMLLYGERIGQVARNLMPGGHDPRTDDYPSLVQRAVSRYVGGQLLFSILMGLTTAIGLYIYGVLGIFPDGSKFAVAFGTIYGVAELIPYIGPISGRGDTRPRRAVYGGPADCSLGDTAVCGAAAARGPRRRAPDLRANAAHQPVARDLRAALRAAGLRHPRGARSTAAGRDPARNGGLPARASRARTLGQGTRSAALEGPSSRRGAAPL